jgi:hypothetical protein
MARRPGRRSILVALALIVVLATAAALVVPRLLRRTDCPTEVRFTGAIRVENGGDFAALSEQTDALLTGIAFGKGVWILTGFRSVLRYIAPSQSRPGGLLPREQPVIYFSADGRSWRAVGGQAVTGEGDLAIWGVHFGNGLWVAVGAQAPEGGQRQRPVVWTSADGRQWTRAYAEEPPDPRFGRLNSVAWFGGTWLAVGAEQNRNGAVVPAVWRSADARNWEMVEGVPAVDIGGGEPKALASGPSGVIAVAQPIGGAGGVQRQQVWTSTDGKAWRARSQFTGTHGAEVLGVAWAGNRWLAYGTGASEAGPDGPLASWESPDAAVWTRLPQLRFDPPGPVNVYAAAASNQEWLAVGQSNAGKPAVWQLTAEASGRSGRCAR